MFTKTKTDEIEYVRTYIVEKKRVILTREGGMCYDW